MGDSNEVVGLSPLSFDSFGMSNYRTLGMNKSERLAGIKLGEGLATKVFRYALACGNKAGAKNGLGQNFNETVYICQSEIFRMPGVLFQQTRVESRLE